MATIGILINHYDARNDIRDLVAELAREHRVILLGPPESVLCDHLTAGVEFRPCRQVHKVRRWLFNQLYRHFGFIPKSRENFFINELFKLVRLSGVRKALARVTLAVRMWSPLRIQPESYLNWIAVCDSTSIEDIDGFLFITDFSDNALAARIISTGKPVCAYVYSWDHPCKHTVMTTRIPKYAVWNTRLADDLHNLQGIPLSSCEVVGATQLVRIHDILPYLQPPGSGLIEGRPYFYFGCGVGALNLARQEMLVVRRLAESMSINAPNYLLLIRPYPMSHGINLRPLLEGLPNVRWDDGFKTNQVGRSLANNDIEQRIRLQRGSRAFFHIGTTMGYEGAFLDIPCVLILPPHSGQCQASDFRQLQEFTRQYHLVNHLRFSNNTVGLGDDLDEVVKQCHIGAAVIRSDNQRVRAGTPLRSMPEIAANLARLSLS